MQNTGRGRGRGCGGIRRRNTDQREDDVQRELKALDQLTLSDDNAAPTDFETLRNKFEDDIVATVVPETAAAQPEVAKDEPEGQQAESVEKNPDNIGVQNEGASAVEADGDDYVPSNLIDAAREFRAHSKPGFKRFHLHFFCTICSCPAGSDSFMCRKRGHLVCKLCKAELNLKECLFLEVEIGGKKTLCNSSILELKSPLGEAIFKTTSVSCKYRQNGCKTQGPWKVVEEHQKTCQFVKKLEL